MLQAISWENCLVNMIMQTNPEKGERKRGGERRREEAWGERFKYVIN